MASSVNVNGKEYLPSTQLAVSFGYSSDYISKLARDEKIIGTQIDRQWFIEPQSLETFLHQMLIEKQIRKDELRKQRKIEQASFQNVAVKKELPIKGSFPITLAESLAVFACGIFFGSLVWVAHDNGVQVGDLSDGLASNITFIASSIVPPMFYDDGQKIASTNKSLDLTAGPIPGVSNQSSGTEEVFETLPTFNNHGTASSSAGADGAQETVSKMDLPFSDEVVAFPEDNNGEVIQPVFKDTGTSTDSYRLVPLNQPKK